jgi:hypothetical protein
MRRFAVQHSRGQTSVMEVEIEILSAMEDPTVLWLPEGEFKARVMAPTSLYDQDGKPPVWYSHAIYWTIHGAWARAERDVRSAFDFNLRKYGIPYTEEDVKAKLADIQEVLLPTQ